MKHHRESGIALLTALLIMLLMSSLMVGFMILLMTDQQLTGVDRDHSQAFYAAEAGMEKLTADLGTLFSSNYAPSAAEINTLTLNPPSTIPGVSYYDPLAGSGYRITPLVTDSFGNPKAQNQTILSGPYQGLTGELTHYTLTVTSRTLNGSEVKLQRYVQTVGIPVFQFGIFSDTDLSFFAGPNFNFGGRVHTNGNLFLAEGDGSTLTISDRVTAVQEVIRTNLENGWNNTANYNGTVSITTGSGQANLTQSQGSLVGTIPSAFNEPTWSNVSLGTYNGNLRNGRTGAKKLQLALTTYGGQQIDLIRRPLQNENINRPLALGERYFAEASMKILLSDNVLDIGALPCVDTTTPPVDLRTLAVPVAALPAWYTAGIPLAASGGGTGGPPSYDPTKGYWQTVGTPIISGFLKIEIQTAFGAPCGTWKDVTKEILNLGVAGRNLYPQTSPTDGITLPALPGGQVAPSACADPSPNAVIRLERVRDNPSNYTLGGGCGVSGSTVPPKPTDYWPNVLFDTREGNLRDNCPGGGCGSQQLTPGGVMHYVELDVNNLSRWLTGAIGTSGTQAKDNATSQNNFLVYFSDRRTNFTSVALPTWPPASPSGNETGEYGFEDFANPASQWGCPNGILDPGEDNDSLGGIAGQPRTYGQNPVWPANLLPGVNPGILNANPNCTGTGTNWPGAYLANTQDARINPPLFFRRALKIRNGSNINLGVCPNGVNCGLNITSENPVYVQGDFNAPGGSFGGAHVATAVLGDAFTFLSNKWNDINSFAFPYNLNNRTATTSWYRVAVAAGKGAYFPQPTGYANPRDFGTDGGSHNFLRYLENWGGQTLNFRGSIVSLFYNRQATGLYKCCTTVYSPPSRGYNFDTDFLQPSLLPPRTPMFRDVNTTGFTQLLMSGQ